MLIKLNRKLEYDVRQKNERGEMETQRRECTELELDFEAITGRDLIAANKEAVKLEGPSLSPILSQAYQAAVAARAAGIPMEAILNTNAVDFTAITVSAQDFLLNTGLKG